MPIKDRYRHFRNTLVSKSMNVDSKNCILLFGDPRGGSTWLTEMVKELVNAPVIWEPLAKGPINNIQQLGFGWRVYIPEEYEWQEAKEYFSKLFRGEILNEWLMSRTTAKELVFADNLLFKFCRGNAALPWIVNNFKFNNEPIYLVRHPFAVVASQLKQGGWNFNFREFDYTHEPFTELYSVHESFLKTLKYKEEALVAMWCITNLVPLNNAKNNKKWITVAYEDLVLNPELIFDRITSRWNFSSDKLNINFEKASSTTIEGSPIKGRNQIEYWTKELTSEQIRKMVHVLNYFKVEMYDNDPYPCVKFTN